MCPGGGECERPSLGEWANVKLRAVALKMKMLPECGGDYD